MLRPVSTSKDDLLRWHAAVYAIRRELEERHVVSPHAFKVYDELRVTPLHLHRDRRAHMIALDQLLVDVLAALDRKRVARVERDELGKPREVHGGIL